MDSLEQLEDRVKQLEADFKKLPQVFAQFAPTSSLSVVAGDLDRVEARVATAEKSGAQIIYGLDAIGERVANLEKACQG